MKFEIICFICYSGSNVSFRDRRDIGSLVKPNHDIQEEIDDDDEEEELDTGDIFKNEV